MVSKSKLSSFSRKTTRWRSYSWARSRRPCALWSRCTTTSCPSRTICASVSPSPTSKLIHYYYYHQYPSLLCVYVVLFDALLKLFNHRQRFCFATHLNQGSTRASKFLQPLKHSSESYSDNWSRAYCVAAPLLWTKNTSKQKQTNPNKQRKHKEGSTRFESIKIS